MEIKYSKGAITPEEVIKHLSLSGKSSDIYAEIITNKEVVKKARELNIEITDEELQQFADNLRANLGIYSYEETLNFLNHYGLTEDDFEQYCELSILTSVLKDRFADENKIKEYFINNRSEFDHARISIILVEDESLANEILMQATEEDEDFHGLAKKYSLDETTKHAGGHVGLISRSLLPPDLTAKVFNATDGDILGPYEWEGKHELILVEALKRAALNDDLKETIKERIFEEWAISFLRDGINVE